MKQEVIKENMDQALAIIVVNFVGTNQIHVKLKNHYSGMIFLQSLGQRNKILVEGIISKFHGIL